MKILFAIFLLVITCVSGYGQNHAKKGPTDGRGVFAFTADQSPLVIFKSKTNPYQVDSTIYTESLLKHIDPKWIDSISIITPHKGHDHIQQATRGQMIIFLNEKRYPNVFKVLEIYLKQHIEKRTD